MTVLTPALVRRTSYRRGIPFNLSAALAVVTTLWLWHGVTRATSIWTFALLAAISTAFALFCGGRFRTFFITIAVIPPFLFILGWLLSRQSAGLGFPGKAVSDYFLYFVAAPILVVWVVATLLSQKERHA